MTWDYYGWHRSLRQYWEPLRPGLKVISTVPGPMIPIEMLRSQCEVIPTMTDSDGVESNPEDDPRLLAYLEAAIEHAENFTGMSIALRTWETALDSFPSGPANAISLPRGPFISVDSFYAPEGGSSDGEFDLGDDYTVDDYRTPARLLPVSSWPTMTRATNAIRIRFRAGYRTETYFDTDYDGAEMLPAVIRQALLVLVGHFNENREDSVDKVLTTIPNGFEALLKPKQVRIGFA